MKGSIYERSLKFHEAHQGKIALKSKVSLKTKDDLSLAYTPGVAAGVPADTVKQG